MKKQELLKAFKELNTGKNDCDNCYDCNNCDDCDDCYNCDDCNNCYYCDNCNNCYNCYDCDYCYNCILCKGLNNKTRGYWLLNKEVTQEEFKAALAELNDTK